MSVVSVLTVALVSDFSFFFLNDPSTTEIYTLSLHDALPISGGDDVFACDRNGQLFAVILCGHGKFRERVERGIVRELIDRKSTRLNSSHANISYAVFCLKKKKSSRTTTSKHKMNS